MSKPSLLSCCLMILADQCPPDRSMYLCTRDEEGTCAECWRHYAFWVAGCANPYRDVSDLRQNEPKQAGAV